MIFIKLAIFFVLFGMIDPATVNFEVESITSKRSKFCIYKATFINLKNGSVLGNTTVKVLRTVETQIHFMTLKAAKSENDNFDITVFESKVDFCRVVEGIRTSILSKIMFQNAAESGNHSLACPIVAGTYKHLNQLYTNQYLPPFPTFLFPSGKGKFLMKNRVHGRVEGMKKAVKLYEWEITGYGINADMFPN